MSNNTLSKLIDLTHSNLHETGLSPRTYKIWKYIVWTVEMHCQVEYMHNKLHAF